MPPPEFWSVPREWEGETVFIIAGGPSVTQEMVDRLKGRRVIAINSSYTKAPWADFLFFGDGRWWKEHHNNLKNVTGRLVTVEGVLGGPPTLRLKKYPPDKSKPFGPSPSPEWLAVRRTSLTGADDLARWLGSPRRILVGADGKKGIDGRTHHHTPHRWPQKPHCWDDQRKDLEMFAAGLKTIGGEVFNANPNSTFRMFPFIDFEAALAL